MFTFVLGIAVKIALIVGASQGVIKVQNWSPKKASRKVEHHESELA